MVHTIKFENRFFLDERFIKLIHECATSVKCGHNLTDHLLAGKKKLFRARIYRCADAMDRMGNGDKYFPFQGFDAKNSFVPSAEKSVGQGRINPDNIRYLYTSSDIDTSILEVRARPGEYVSVAEIEIIESLKMIDIAIDAVSCWEDEKKDVWFCEFLLALSSLFQRQHVESGDYYLCQYIGEYWKNIGIDGVCFKSAMSRAPYPRGYNYTIFNYSKCKVVASKLYKISYMTVNTYPQIDSKSDNR